MARKCDLSGKGVMVGNNVSHANNRTRRRYLPNLQNVTFSSDVLGKVRMRVCTSALRTVDTYGGFDEFLMNSKNHMLSEEAKRLKRQVCAARGAVAE